MTDKTTSGSKKSLITRRGVLRAFAATTIVAAPTYANAAGFLRGAGDIRRLRMYSGRTGEHLDTIYWIEGNYIKDAIKEINYFMRDWREDAVKSMDVRNFDIITAAHTLLDTTEPYLLLSGYRTPKTNAMLRSRSRGVAKNSLHMKGQANDVRLKSRTVNQIYKAGLSCGAGGVGKYSRSNFVHMDCGAVRTWGS
ncbi:YcbK family protein [Profundibacter sp.]